MNELQKLALEHIKELAEQLNNEAITLGNTIGLKREEFDAPKHTYPIACKSRTISRWADAILESEEN